MQINADALSYVYARICNKLILTLLHYCLITRSLQVFDAEKHASTHSSKVKEGLSLFGILDTTRTSLGRFLLRQWLLRPSLSLDVVNSRHDAVECLSRPDNISTGRTIAGHLKGLKNVPRVLKMVGRGLATVDQWIGVVKVCSEPELTGRLETHR